eukprot:122659_1
MKLSLQTKVIVIVISFIIVVNYSFIKYGIFKLVHVDHSIVTVTTSKGLNLDFIEYKSQHISDKLYKLDKLWNITNNADKLNKSHKCTKSIYILNWLGCCALQFSINYLYSLGFQQFEGMLMQKIQKRMTNDMNNNLGCYGLKIEQRNTNKREIFQNIYKKTQLYQTVMNYCHKNNITNYCHQWLPITYNLQNNNELILFFQNLPCSNGSTTKWIIKTEKNNGKGILLVNNFNYLRAFFLTKYQMEQTQCIIDNNLIKIASTDEILDKQSVAQQTILNTLKIKNKNFSFRVWVNLASYSNPLILLYIGTVIMQAQDENDIRSNAGHQGAERAMNMKQFDEYFMGNVNSKQIIDQIKNITKIVFLASYDKHESINRYNESKNDETQHYLFIGMDFIVTRDNQVKFLELQTAPGTTLIPKICFEENVFGQLKFTQNVWLCAYAKRVFEEMTDIQLEIAIKKRNKYKIDVIDSIREFDVILWEKTL